MVGHKSAFAGRRRATAVKANMSKKPNVGRHDNSSKAWSLTDIAGLADCILQGTSIKETAVFLYRDVSEVRAKIAELKVRH
jgi:hypothetical protein